MGLNKSVSSFVSVSLAFLTVSSCGSGGPLKTPDGGSAGAGSGGGGSGVAGSGVAGSGAAGSGGGGSGVAGSGGAGGAGPCPTQTPTAGATCTQDNLQCEYGDDPNPFCRPNALCFQGKWQVNPVSATECPSTKATTCPASLAAANDAVCTENGSWCTWPPGTICHCTDCNTGPISQVCSGNPTWHCPYQPTGCPAVIPRAGSPCTDATAYCSYGCEWGTRRCTGGLWTEGPGNCPISRRAAKEDIHYLSPAEIDRLASETAAMKLARYRYRSPAFGEPGTHLGFIIDDNPDLPAVSATKQTVDLYGFASMLLATSQAQARRIEALEREVARLHKRH